MADAPASDATFLAAVLDQLPAATFVIDGIGNVRWGSAPAAALVGDAAADFRGRSVLEFVTPDTAWAYASAVAMASDYPDVMMGPLRIAYLDGSGERRDADLWATNCLDDPLVGGIVCLITEQTASSGMTEAVAALAAGGTPVDVAGLVCRAMRGAPVNADASVLRLRNGALTTVAASAGAPDLTGDADDEPWATLLATGVRQLYGELDGAPAALATAAAAADGASVEAVWVEPILGTGGGPPDAALVLWRRRRGNPSPNQMTSIHGAAAVLTVALGPPPAADPD